MLPGCFHLLDELPDTVYRLCDLLMTAVKRNGPEYRDLILRQVVNQVSIPICSHNILIGISILEEILVHIESNNWTNMTSVYLWSFFDLKQGCLTQFVDGLIPADFRFNPN